LHRRRAKGLPANSRGKVLGKEKIRGHAPLKLPKLNEYNVLLLVVIAWITVWAYPSFRFPITLNPVLLYLLIPNFLLTPILWAVLKSKINAFLKVFLLLTSWFLLVVAVMVVTKFADATSIIQAVMGAGTLMSLLASLKTTRLRWLNFVWLTFYWAVAMPKSFGTSWAMFDPSKFFFGDFIQFILPLVLYFHLIDLRKSESGAITYTRKHIEGYRKIRVFRFGHFGAYLLLVAAGIFLTLDLFFLKLFGPSAYLLTSVELASPMAWLIISLMTIAILILAPVTVVAVGQKIKKLLSSR
jgi:hypothetical protein